MIFPLFSTLPLTPVRRVSAPSLTDPGQHCPARAEASARVTHGRRVSLSGSVSGRVLRRDWHDGAQLVTAVTPGLTRPGRSVRHRSGSDSRLGTRWLLSRGAEPSHCTPKSDLSAGRCLAAVPGGRASDDSDALKIIIG